MPVSQYVFGYLLAAALFALAFFVAKAQRATLAKLRAAPPPDDELGYERGKAIRRTWSAALIALMGVLLVVQMVRLEPPAGKIAEERKDFDAANAPELTPEQKDFLRVWGGVWIAFLLLLLAVVSLAAVDLVAIRRYGMKQYRRLRDDRRAMIARQVTRMRREREEEE